MTIKKYEVIHQVNGYYETKEFLERSEAFKFAKDKKYAHITENGRVIYPVNKSVRGGTL